MGAIGDLLGIGSVQPPLGFRSLDVLTEADAVIEQRSRALLQNPVELRPPQAQRPLAMGAGRDRPRDLVHELLAALTEVLGLEGQSQQSDPAVDVVAHAAWRDDALGGVECGKPSDREAVSLMDVRHRDGRVDDPRQSGDVLELLERKVVGDRIEHLPVGEDAGRHAHVRARRGGDLPELIVDPAEVHA